MEERQCHSFTKRILLYPCQFLNLCFWRTSEIFNTRGFLRNCFLNILFAVSGQTVYAKSSHVEIVASVFCKYIYSSLLKSRVTQTGSTKRIAGKLRIIAFPVYHPCEVPCVTVCDCSNHKTETMWWESFLEKWEKVKFLFTTIQKMLEAPANAKSWGAGRSKGF